MSRVCGLAFRLISRTSAVRFALDHHFSSFLSMVIIIIIMIIFFKKVLLLLSSSSSSQPLPLFCSSSQYFCLRWEVFCNCWWLEHMCFCLFPSYFFPKHIRGDGKADVHWSVIADRRWVNQSNVICRQILKLISESSKPVCRWLPCLVSIYCDWTIGTVVTELLVLWWLNHWYCGDNHWYCGDWTIGTVVTELLVLWWLNHWYCGDNHWYCGDWTIGTVVTEPLVLWWQPLVLWWLDHWYCGDWTIGTVVTEPLVLWWLNHWYCSDWTIGTVVTTMLVVSIRWLDKTARQSPASITACRMFWNIRLWHTLCMWQGHWASRNTKCMHRW